MHTRKMSLTSAVRSLAGVVLSLTLCAATSAYAGAELILNGDFEAGNATDQTWGSYAG